MNAPTPNDRDTGRDEALRDQLKTALAKGTDDGNDALQARDCGRLLPGRQRPVEPAMIPGKSPAGHDIELRRVPGIKQPIAGIGALPDVLDEGEQHC